MAVTNGYTSVTDLNRYIGLDSGDTVDETLLEQAINAASRMIDAYCRRRFYADDEATARYFTTGSSDLIYVDDFHTSTGLVVATDSGADGTYSTTWATSDYLLEPTNSERGGISGWPYDALRAVGDYSFTGRWTVRNRPYLKVTAKWGWAAVPDVVEQACLVLASEIFKLKDAPFGVAGFGEFGAVRVRENPMVARLLDPVSRGPVIA